jgi:hypothetical protein
MRDETEIKLKRAYWQGVFDALNPAEKSRSEKSEKERVTAGVWLTSLDWMLGHGEENGSTLGKADTTKDWDTQSR